MKVKRVQRRAAALPLPRARGRRGPQSAPDSAPGVPRQDRGIPKGDEEVPDEEYSIPIGRAKVVQEGNDITVVTWGAMRWICEKMIEEHGEEASVELIDMRTISPLDIETVVASVQKTGRCVIVQEGSRSFGVAAEISAQLMEKCLLNLQAPVMRVTSPDIPPPYLRGEMLTLPSEQRIWKAIQKTLEF